MCMKAAKQGDTGAHLKHAIAYICNEAKTENGRLVGGINCLPDYAYEQMIGTKEMFGRLGGRQGYHFVISLSQGEGTTEQMYSITKKFAEEFLCGEYEGVYAVHTDRTHLHGHLVFNSVNMITSKKYDYKKGDWKHVIQPIVNRFCEEYDLSIVAAEYSREPVNMNRRQWEQEQSWSEFIRGDMYYCRSRAKDFDEFIALLEYLGYEVKIGEHIAVRAERMRRNRRLDTIDKEFTVENLQNYYTEQKINHKYVVPPVYSPGYALMLHPQNDFQRKFHGKLYRMCVVQKYRFRYKYTRYKQNLIRMKELQEEYLFLRREGINSWADVYKAERQAKQELTDIDAQKQELYREHVRCKYEYEKNGDEAAYLYHEEKYRGKLEDLKVKRKAMKQELVVIRNCMQESIFEHLEIPLDVDIDNLFMVDVPVVEKDMYTQEKVSVLSDRADNETDTVVEEVAVTEAEIADIAEMENLTNIETETAMTKARYEQFTDKEKIEWLGIAGRDVGEAIGIFVGKMESIGAVARYGDEMLNEFMRLEALIRTEERENDIESFLYTLNRSSD